MTTPRLETGIGVESAAVPFRPGSRAIVFILVAMTLCAFWPVLRCGFIELDDPIYVIDNAHVNSGLVPANIAWALATTHGGLWIPMTWISLMADAQIYGLHAWGFHLTNLLFHCANVALIFIFLKRATGAMVPSFLLAAVYAVHPLFVESVTWVTERKDVLCVFFGLLALICYTNYARGRRWQYLLTLLLFALGLMAKPLLVSLPFLLLLLDYWPLNRLANLQPGPPPNPDQAASQRAELAIRTTIAERRSPAFLLLEKAPFALLAIGAGIATVIGSAKVEALVNIQDAGVGQRVATAAISYSRYLLRIFWPAHLAVFYPYPKSWPAYQIILAFAVLAAITLVAIRNYRSRPWLIVGWLWFLIALVPNIGLLQAGVQSMADRFVYLPALGILLMVFWSVPQRFWQTLALHPDRWTYFGIVAFLLAVCTYIQIGYWSDSLTLYQHALDVTADNVMVEMDVGTLLAEKGDYDGALQHFAKAVSIDPERVRALTGFGQALVATRRYASAIPFLQRAVQIDPNMASAHYMLGIALAMTNQKPAAIAQFTQALRLDPANPKYQKALRIIQESSTAPATTGSSTQGGKL